VILESRETEKQKSPFLFENRLKFTPKIYVESPTPKCVGYTLPKIRKNSNVDEKAVSF
jgi:hypothetical protein